MDLGRIELLVAYEKFSLIAVTILIYFVIYGTWTPDNSFNIYSTSIIGGTHNAWNCFMKERYILESSSPYYYAIGKYIHDASVNSKTHTKDNIVTINHCTELLVLALFGAILVILSHKLQIINNSNTLDISAISYKYHTNHVH